jgi:flagellar assembly factor FliW
MAAVNTLFFGEIEVEENAVITFTQGIPGFEDLTKFIIIQPDTQMPFSYLQSLEEGQISLLITNPFLFFDNYVFDLSESIQQELKLEQAEDVSVWVVVNVNKTSTKATVNLMAPIVVNEKERFAKQIILHDSGYQIKHELILPTADLEDDSSKVEG